MKRILVALDSSPRAPRVFAAAVDLARQTGARLTLFRSVGLPPEVASLDVLSVSPNVILETMVAAARADLARLQAEEPVLVDAIDARVGSPWDAICAEAHRMEADLIVIGSHGYSGLDRILGTTAAKVVNHAACSVLVVR